MMHVEGAVIAKRTSREFLVESIPLDGPMRYEAHRHERHQLAWMAAGEMELTVEKVLLHVDRRHVVWIPSYHQHQMTVPTGGHLVTAYAAPHLRPDGARWGRLAVTPATPLVCALLTDLTATQITRRRRGLAQALLFDALETSLPSQHVLAVPDDPRARAVADALFDDVADPTDLVEWADRLGVSAKTLTRAFVAATGLTFREWRTTARMHRARAMLATGATIADTSAAVGYRSTSAFIAAYRSALGTTPGREARSRPRRGDRAAGVPGPVLHLFNGDRSSARCGASRDELNALATVDMFERASGRKCETCDALIGR